MADNKETEQTTGDNETTATAAVPVKKKVAKKKAAKKKVAKKRAVRTKAAIKKKAAASAAAGGGSKSEEKTSAAPAGESKPAATVAAAATPAAGSQTPTGKTTTAADASTSTGAKVVARARFEKPEPPEDDVMAIESKGSGVFWVKIIFWLLIIALVFIFIRSLAKHPDGQPAASTGEEGQEVVTAPAAPADSTPATVDAVTGAEASSGTETSRPAAMPAPFAPVSDEPVADKDAAAATADSGTTAESTTETAAETTAMPETPIDEAPAEAGGTTQGAEASSDAGQGTAPDKLQSSRDRHEESVARVLQEFDDLRAAAQAEMEAMRNLIEAERELHEAMMAPPPPPAYPGWGRPESNYGPYGPPPQYPRY